MLGDDDDDGDDGDGGEVLTENKFKIGVGDDGCI